MAFNGPRKRFDFMGMTALYEPHEQVFMAKLTASAEAGEITEAELRQQVEVIHTLKAEFDATMVPEPDADAPPQETLL